MLVGSLFFMGRVLTVESGPALFLNQHLPFVVPKTLNQQTFQVSKLKVLAYISCMDTAYVSENPPTPQNSPLRLSTSILDT